MTQGQFPRLREPGWFSALFDRVFGAPLRLTVPDPARLILWAPVALGGGAAAYFWPAIEPAEWIGATLALVSAVLLVAGVVLRSDPRWLYALVLTAFLGLGFALAQWRTYDATPPELPATERAVEVEGWIEAVERGGTRPRLRIRVVAFGGLENPPHRIRVRAGLGQFQPGDAVQLRAVLTPLPGPAAPGGYDPARAAWFDRIALSGFAVSSLSASTRQMGAGFERGLAQFRWQLAEQIRAKAGARTGGVAAALLTGDRSGVDEADAEALRVSGLGHILAISGLHMALFAGGIYFVVRLGLAAIEPYARAHDPRKPAAVIALVAATGYLILSGGAIPTQRAWVMAGVVLVGVMLDRRAFSMRSLALAALVVIFLAPQSVVEAGFQMSFAAVAALIAVYEVWSRVRPQVTGTRGWISQLADAMGGLSTTSLVAGAATGAFAAFHFQRMAAYGLIANLAAMPIFTFWVMPAGVVALGLAPVGLDGPALAVMDAGLRLVLAIAHWTSGLAGAGVNVIAADGAVVALYAAGFAAMTLGLGLLRLAGVAGCLAALGLWMVQSPPDLMITDSGVVIAEFDEPGVLQASSLRSSRFDRNVFLQRAGVGNAPIDRAALACDSQGCVGVTASGITIAFANTPEALQTDCLAADIVIYDGTASSWRRRRCYALLLDDAERARTGGLEFSITRGQLDVTGIAYEQRRQRLWSRPNGQAGG